MVKFQYCDLFKSTYIERSRNPQIVKKFDEFIRSKSLNPIAPYGSSDKPFRGGGFFSNAVPKLRHAHLTHDISIVYLISGFNPTQIKLYGLFSHDEMGTGQPANIKKQKSLSRQLSNQIFNTD
jgi:hypothetical protein